MNETKIREQLATLDKVTKEAIKSKKAAQKFLRESGIKKIVSKKK